MRLGRKMVRLLLGGGRDEREGSRRDGRRVLEAGRRGGDGSRLWVEEVGEVSGGEKEGRKGGRRKGRTLCCSSGVNCKIPTVRSRRKQEASAFHPPSTQKKRKTAAKK